MELRGRSVADFTIQNTNPADRVSDNFCAHELVRSDIATRHGIDNWFASDTHLQSAVILCRMVLQPLRDRFWPFTPNSVYRSQELERALKKRPKNWVSYSQHTRGEAADIEIPGLTNDELFEWIRAHLTFDHLIKEFVDPNVQGSGWIHVSYAAVNRGAVMVFDGKDYHRLT